MLPSEDNLPDSSFKARKVNSSTFVIQEDDEFREHPFIYAKVHPKAPVLIVCDTGCDEPRGGVKDAKYTRLRVFIEHYPLPFNNDKPINPGGERQYFIICSHCHFDHICGISKFLEGGTTEIIASAAGRNFIESDLDSHGLFKYVDKVAPYYQVTHWALVFERLQYPLPKEESTDTKPIDLGITFVQQPGHTPDSLAWYDHDEMHLYVGDSLYEEGEENMEIVWPPDGNLIEWVFSMQKLQYLIKSENARAIADAKVARDAERRGQWDVVERKVTLGAGHQTHSADAEEIMGRLEKLFRKTLRGEVPVIKKFYHLEEAYYTWREDGWNMRFMGPARLMDDARKFFKGTDIMEKGWSLSLSPAETASVNATY